MKKLLFLISFIMLNGLSNQVFAQCTAPSNVFAQTLSSNDATISWTENGTATQWNVTVTGGGSTTSFPTTTNPYTVTGLTQATVYNITVVSICSPTDSSSSSVPLTVNTQSCANAPTSIFAQNITATTASISWAGGTATGGYEISLTPVNATTPPIIFTSSTSPFIATGLLPSSGYNCSVRSICASGAFSPWSASFTFYTTTTPPPTPVCGGQFIDNGGLNANYTNSADVTTTIYPATAGEVVTVTFTSFDTEATWDGLYVFNGNSITAPQISSGNPAGNIPGGLSGAYYGTNIPGPFTSSAVDGSLTFRFRSDSAINNAGWVSNVTCGLPASCPQPMGITITGITTTGATINWSASQVATQWEVFVVPAGSPAPTAASTGIITSTRPYVLSGLTIATAYTVYVRNICSTSDFSAWTGTSFTTVGCTAPAFSQSSTTTNNATVTWGTSIAATQQYEVYMATSGSPAPTVGTSGVLVTGTTYSVQNLSCGTSYVFYVRSICSPTVSSPWSLARTVSTLVCTLTTGTPQNMSACSDTGVNCFTLTNNDANILGTLNPADYTIVYYTNSARTIVAATPYCLTNATATIYTALTKIATNEKQNFSFTVASKSVNTTTVLPVMSGCDDNFDGFVILNLTTAPITTTNTLAYYTTLANATAQTNPITIPTAYSLAITATTTTIFIREIIANACDNIYSMQLGAYSDCNLAYTCATANSLCGALGVPFANTHQGIQAEVGNAYGCLSSKPNPTWFYVHVSNSGNLNLKIEQNTDITFASTGTGRDVDYVVYGPFTSIPTAACGSLTASQIVSCSFSAAAVEYPVINNAVAGQYYLMMTTNFSNQLGFIKISALPTSTGAIDCSGIRMNAFIDSNTNGTQEVGEVNFPLGQFNYTVNAGTPHNVVSPVGNYTIYDSNPANLYNLSYTIDPNYTAAYSIGTASYTGVSIVPNGGAVTYNFPITITQPYNDLGVTVLPVNAPRAGTTYKNVVVYANLGNQILPTGTVNFNKDATTTITTISQAGTTPTATGFSYDFTNLLPFEVRYITVTMSVPTIPTVAINQLLTNTASIVPPTGDIVASNDNSSNTQAIVAAYDPNDKTEAHGGRILFSSFNPNEYLTYTIRFENEGNASAIDVRVTDVLDSRIDENSVKMVAASHNYTLDREGNNLTWNFDNIQLPVSIANTDIGKGYFTFQAKLKPGYAVGTIIPNTARIYFDTNPAIVTNTFNTEFTAALATNSFDLVNFALYPNPVSNIVNIETANENISSLAITDMLGKQIKSIENVGINKTNFDVSSFAKGMYLVTIKTESGLKQTKKLVVE